MWQQRLRAGLHQWQTSNYDDGALLRGAPLSEAENWLSQRRNDLNETEREFIQAGLALREKETAEREAQLRRELEVARQLAESEKRRAEDQAQAASHLRKRAVWLAGVGMLTILLAVATGAFGSQSARNAKQAIAAQETAEARRLEAEEQRQVALEAENRAQLERDEADRAAQIARSQQLAAQALAHSTDQLDLALLLSVEAVRTADSLEAQSGLKTMLETSPYLTMFMHGHTDQVRTVALSPDGQILASGSADNAIILWDVATGRPLTNHTATVRSVTFSPDGKRLASAGGDHVVLWDVSPGSWQARACRRANRNLTEAEWRQFFNDQPYRATCPDLPVPVTER